MPSTLFIRPVQVYQIDECEYDWALYDVAGEQIKVGSSMPFSMIDQTLMQNGIENVDLVALWPAYACFSTSVSLPGNQARYLQQALPFAVEEQVAQDIEQIHIALGDKNASGEYSVINTDKSLFAAFFEYLESENLSEFKLKSIYCDADLVPLTDEDLVVLLTDTGVLIKGADKKLIATNDDNLIPLLDSILLNTNEEETDSNQLSLRVFVTPGRADDYQMLCAQLDQYPNINTIVDQTSLSEFELLCESYFNQSKTLTSLCQGEFQIVNASSNTWRKWRAVASIAFIGFVLQLGAFIGQGVYYQKQADVVGEQAVATYKKIVPNASRVSLQKLPRIIKGKINQSNAEGLSESGFLELLGEAGYQFNKSQFKSQLSFKTISFNETRGELVMEMQAKSFDQLESLKNAIVSAGYTAKISSAVQEKDYFRGRISVSGA